MMRLVHPEYVDIGYASSAPLKLYDKTADQFSYYELLTEAADRASPGCSVATKQTLTEVDHIIHNTPDFETLAYDELGVCPGSIPDYIDNSALFSQELMQVIETSFADANMIGNYPPSKMSWFPQLCHVFQDESKDSLGKVKEFWKHLEVQDNSTDCFNMKFQLSEGDKATISCSDWSGCGPGRDGLVWDFQCCTSLVPEMGFSERSMFPHRKWTYEWLTQHCMDRFGVVGDPLGMVKQWHFDDLVGRNASRILFVNGGNDLWSPGSYVEDLSDSLLAIDMPNGAHHSEVYALKDDTKDVKRAQKDIAKILGRWLKEIKKGE
jgi:lysosomal Pro-X carboxypeptidase